MVVLKTIIKRVKTSSMHRMEFEYLYSNTLDVYYWQHNGYKIAENLVFFDNVSVAKEVLNQLVEKDDFIYYIEIIHVYGGNK